MIKTINILIIDDSNVDRMIAKTHFEHVLEKVNIQEVGNGKEAICFLESCQDNFPDLIILDINMPLMDGFAFLEKFEQVFWKQYPHTLVYMISSSNAEEDIERSNRFASLDGFLTKPMDREKTKRLRNTIQCI